MKRWLNSFVLILFLLNSQNVFAEDYYEDEFGPSYTEYEEPVNDSYSRYSEPTEVSSAFSEAEEYADNNYYDEPDKGSSNGSGRMPATIASPGERVIVVNPRIHAWGAYSESGKLLRSGTATSGASWCEDLGRSCRTKSGVFRIRSLGSENCKSSKFPLPDGGAHMPYCMFFNGGQGIHGSYEVRASNVSHGCVRVSVSDARWLRYKFAGINTKVIIKGY